MLLHDTPKGYHIERHLRELQQGRDRRAPPRRLVRRAPYIDVGPRTAYERDGLRADDAEEPPYLPLVLALRPCVDADMQRVRAGARPVAVQTEAVYGREYELGHLVLLPAGKVLLECVHGQPVGVDLWVGWSGLFGVVLRASCRPRRAVLPVFLCVASCEYGYGP